MADVLDSLNKLGTIVVGAAQEIVSLRGQLAVANEELEKAKAAPKATTPVPERERAEFKEPKVPAPPKPRKAIGTATTVAGREPLQYAASDMDKRWLSGYRAGWAAAQPPAGSYSAAQRAEDDAWAEYRAGRGPHPKRR